MIARRPLPSRETFDRVPTDVLFEGVRGGEGSTKAKKKLEKAAGNGANPGFERTL